MTARLAMLLAVCACDMLSTDAFVATPDLHLAVTIDASDTAPTQVTAALTGPFTPVVLGPDDALSLEAGGAPIALEPTAEDAWATGTKSHGPFTFTLHYVEDNDAAAVAAVPPPSGLTASSSSGALVLTWIAQTAGAMTISVSGTCVTPQAINVLTDTGRYVVMADLLQATPSSCPVMVTLSRAVTVTTPFMSAQITQTETAQAVWVP
jgi:hypothetical protein